MRTTIILILCLTALLIEGELINFKSIVGGDAKLEKRLRCLEGHLEDCVTYSKVMDVDHLTEVIKKMDFTKIDYWPQHLEIDHFDVMKLAEIKAFLGNIGTRTEAILNRVKRLKEGIATFSETEFGAKRMEQMLRLYSEYELKLQDFYYTIEELTELRLSTTTIDKKQKSHLYLIKNFFATLEDIDQITKNDDNSIKAAADYTGLFFFGNMLSFDCEKPALEMNNDNLDALIATFKGYFGIGIYSNIMESTVSFFATINLVIVCIAIYLADYMGIVGLLGIAKLQIMTQIFVGLLVFFTQVMYTLDGFGIATVITVTYWIVFVTQSMEAMACLKDAINIKNTNKETTLPNHPIGGPPPAGTLEVATVTERRPTKLTDQGKTVFRITLTMLSWLLMSRVDNLTSSIFGIMITMLLMMLKEKEAPKKLSDFLTGLPMIYSLIRLVITISLKIGRTQAPVVVFILNYGLVGENIVTPKVFANLQTPIVQNFVTHIATTLVLHVPIAALIMLSRAITYKEVNFNLIKLVLTPWTFKSRVYTILMLVLFLLSNNRWWIPLTMFVLTMIERVIEASQTTVTTSDLGLDFLLKIFVDVYDEVSPVLSLVNSEEITKILKQKLRQDPSNPKAKQWKEQIDSINKKKQKEKKVEITVPKKKINVDFKGKGRMTNDIAETAITMNKLDVSKFKRPVYTTKCGAKTGTGVVLRKGAQIFYVTNAHCLEDEKETVFTSPHNGFQIKFRRPTFVTHEGDLAFFKGTSKIAMEMAPKMIMGKPIKMYAVVNGQQVESTGRILRATDNGYAGDYSNVKGTSGGFITQLHEGKDAVVGINFAENTEGNENYFIGLETINKYWPKNKTNDVSSSSDEEKN